MRFFLLENAGGVPLEQRGAETQCQANPLPAANDDPKFAGKILTSGQDGFYILFAAPDGCKVRVGLICTMTGLIPDKAVAPVDSGRTLDTAQRP